MMKVKKISCVIASVFLAIVCLFAGMLGTVKSYTASAESDKILSDFRDSNTSGWTLQGNAVPSSRGVQMLAGSSLVSELTMRNFLMQITFGAMKKGFELSFGDGNNVCSVRFDGAYIRLTGLTTDLGGDLYVMNNMLTGNSIVQIEVIGGEVTVSLKADGEPYDVLGMPIAIFAYGEETSVSNGKIKLSAYDGAMFSVEKINVYSLNASVEIGTENYVAPPADSSETSEEEEKGCGSTLENGALVCLLLTVAGTFLFNRRENDEKAL